MEIHLLVDRDTRAQFVLWRYVNYRFWGSRLKYARSGVSLIPHESMDYPCNRMLSITCQWGGSNIPPFNLKAPNLEKRSHPPGMYFPLAISYHTYHRFERFDI